MDGGDGGEGPAWVYEYVDALRPSYVEQRGLWPLWTHDARAWAREDAPWADRLRVTPGFLLDQALAVEPFAGGSPPLLLRAYHRALELQAGAPFRVRGNEWAEGAAAEALAVDLARALLDRPEGGTSLLTEFAAHALGAAGPDHRERPDREKGRRLAERLALRAGLLPARHGTVTGLADRTVLRLDGEARRIVDTLRDVAVVLTEVEEDGETLFARLLLDWDPALRETLLAVERRRRGGREGDDVRALELWLRAPFLLLADARDVLTSEATRERTAYRLVARRLWGRPAYSTYRKLLSGARRG